MRAHGEILLVSCYALGQQPLALAGPAAFLKQAGFDPACLDLAVERLDGAVDRIARARLIAISVPMHTALRLGFAALGRLRRPGVTICFFGLYARLNEEILRAAGADVVLAAEAERELVVLAEQMAGDVAAAPVAAAPGRTLQRLPVLAPDRSGLPPLERYSRLLVGDERRVAGSVESTRGCLHMCTHCPIPPVYGGRFIAVDAEVVAEDIRRQVAAGARHISFADPDFFNGPRHAAAVTRALAAEHPGVTFDCTVKIEHLLRHSALLPELRAAGCLFITSAVESLSDRVLDILAKGHSRADVVRALELVRAAGISLRPTFVAFTPWTTLDDYLELCAFVRDHALEDEVDPVQLSIRLLVPPGSLLASHPEMAPHLRALDAPSFVWRWQHPDPRMDALAESVAVIVEQAAATDEDAADTFDHVEAAARAAAALPPITRGRRIPRDAARRPARMSEPWFCCAEPTRAQVGFVEDAVKQ